MNLEAHLRARRDEGRKLLGPYVTGGIRSDWLDVVRVIAKSGADVIEVNIPFSDPVMDGPTIQAASVAALDRGTTPSTVLAGLASLKDEALGVPIVVMTYYNLVFHFGHVAFAQGLADAGVSGVILPDLPMEQADDWFAAAATVGIQTVLLVAPNSPDERLRQLCDRAEGFVYAVSTLGVTGERDVVANSARVLSERVKAYTDKPVLVGFGISSAEQAREAATHADGAIVASMLMRRVLDGASIDEIGAIVTEMRTVLDR